MTDSLQDPADIFYFQISADPSAVASEQKVTEWDMDSYCSQEKECLFFAWRRGGTENNALLNQTLGRSESSSSLYLKLDPTCQAAEPSFSKDPP